MNFKVFDEFYIKLHLSLIFYYGLILNKLIKNHQRMHSNSVLNLGQILIYLVIKKYMHIINLINCKQKFWTSYTKVGQKRKFSHLQIILIFS